MKKAIFYAVFLSHLFVFSAFLGFAYGQGSLKDLGVKSTGLLPSNPFYFMKEWTRNVKRAFTFDPLNKLNLDLTVVNEKAAELKKLTLLSQTKPEAVMAAVDNYQYNLDYLITEIDSLKDFNQIDGIDKYLNRLLDLSLKHAELLEELADQFGGQDELVKKIEKADGAVIGLIAIIPQKIEKIEDFRTRFQQVIADQEYDFKELKAAEVLERLGAILADGQLKTEINNLKKDLMVRFSVALQGGFDINDFEQLPIDPMVRLKILDETRKSITDQEMRNQLNVLRQQTLEQIVKEGKVGSQEAQATLDQARASLVTLQGKIKSSPLLDQTKFYIDQASNFLNQGNFSGAYSQAVSAIGVVEDALAQMSLSAKDAKDDLLNVRKEYDRLMSAANNAKLSKNNAPDLFTLFSKAEMMITKAGSAKNPNLQEIKIILANIDLLIKK